MSSGQSSLPATVHPLVTRVFDKACLVSKRFALLARTRQRYVDCCTARGSSPYPVCFKSISFFLAEYVQGVNGSTRSLANLVSNLKLGVELSRQQWLSPCDHYLLSRWMVQLKYDDITPSRRKRPACLALLIRLVAAMDLSSDEDLYDATSYMVAHNLLLRAAELWSGIRAGALLWSSDRSSFVLPLLRTKTVLSGDSISLTVNKFSGKGSSVRLLKRWFDRRNLWDDPEAFLFTLRTGKQSEPFSRYSHGSRRTWTVRFKSRLQELGLDSSYYSGHSFRAGGATDLFNNGVPLATVMKLGRWKNATSALVYFREETELAAAAAAAFKKC